MLKIIVNQKAISLNNAYPLGKHGRRYLTKKGKEFKEAVRTITYLYSKEIKKIKSTSKDDKYSVMITFVFKDKRRRDIDDYFKLCIDALTGIIWQDDSQIYQLIGTKIQPALKDCIIINIFKNII